MKRKKQASSGLAVFMLEELGDARLRCNQLKDYINEAVELIEKSDKRDHFFEVAGHLLHGIPDTLMRLEKSLGATAMAVAKWEYETTKDDLRPEKAEQLEDALKDVRTRRVERRSSNRGFRMNTQEAAQELNRIARAIDETGSIDTDAIMVMVASLESTGRTASSKSDIASVLHGLAKGLSKTGRQRPSRTVLAAALRRVLAETMDVGAAVDPLPVPGGAPFSPLQFFENIRMSAISAHRRGERQMRLAFVDLASVVREIGLLCGSLGATTAPELAERLSKAVLQARRLLTPEVTQQLVTAASRVASNPAVVSLLRSYAEGSQYGGLEVNDAQGAADRLETAALKALSYGSGSRINMFLKELSNLAHDLAYYMGAAVAEQETEEELAVDVFAADKTAAAPLVTHLVDAYREGLELGGHSEREVRAAAVRVGQTVRVAARYAANPSSGSAVRILTLLVDRLHELGFCLGAASARPGLALLKSAKFEEGKPADPTENMSEDDAEKWKTEHNKNKDNFKEASSAAAAKRILQSVAAKVEGDRWTAEVDDDEEYTVLTLAYGIEHDGPKISAMIHRDDEVASVRMGPKVAEVPATASAIERAIKNFKRTIKNARFEEGKPADPTENMSEDDAEKWKTEHDKNKDNFKEARFEEGKPADPTENMSEDDAEKWKTEHDKNKDNFKEASLWKA